MRINDATNQEMSLYHDALDMVDATTDTWPFVKFVRSANFALDSIVRKILTVNGRWQWADSNDTNLSEYATDLVATQTNYTLADDTLVLSRVRVKDKQGKWKTLKPMDKRDASDYFLDQTGEPTHYDKVGRSIMPLPVPDYSVTGGIEVTVQNGSNYFTVDDTIKEPGVESVFHRYISLYCALDYARKYAKDRVVDIKGDIKALDEEIKELYIVRDQDEEHFMSLEKTNEIY